MQVYFNYARYLLTFFCLTAQLNLFGITTPHPVVNQKKKWTILVYMAADNSLAAEGVANIQDMEKVGSDDNISILVYYCTKTSGQKVTKKLIVKKGETLQEGEDSARDTGDQKTLLDALAWAHTSHPSEKFMLILWDHGSGSLNRNKIGQTRACCYDDTTGNFLTDAKLRGALSEIYLKYRKGRKLDIIAFDACLMADIEIAYALQKYANYMIASQETIPGAGFNYVKLLSDLSKGIADPGAFAADIVKAYDEEYQGTGDYTLSVMNLVQLTPVVKNVNEISRFLLQLMEHDSGYSVYNMVKESASKHECTRFEEPSYMDLAHFYANLSAHVITATTLKEEDKQNLLQLLKDGQRSISKCVIANTKGSMFPHASGLSIYMDENRIDETYPTLYWSAYNKPWVSLLNYMIGY